jgi:hypothetical protein
MRLLPLSLLFCVCGIFSLLVTAEGKKVTRDTYPFERAIRDVNFSVGQMTTALRDLERGRNSERRADLQRNLEARGHDVIDKLNQGANSMRRAPVLGAIEAVPLITQVDSLLGTISTAVSTWVST